MLGENTLHSFIFFKRQGEFLSELFWRREAPKRIASEDEEETATTFCWRRADDAFDEIHRCRIKKINMCDDEDKNRISGDEAIDDLVSEIE